MRLVFLSLLFSSGVCVAQPFSADQRLLLWEGTLRGSPRLMGLSGAYVAIAEGAEGITRNPAAAAAKDPRFEHDFNVDFGGTMHFQFPGSTKAQDWDNDGRPDQVEGPFSNLGTQVFYSAVTLQYKNAALGVGLDMQNFVSKSQFVGEDYQRYYNVSLIHAFASLAGSVWKDQILFGVGIETTHALLGYGEQPTGALVPNIKETMGYHGWGVQLGGLWRPENQDYRLGFAFRPQVSGYPATDKSTLGGLVLFKSVAAPARLSLGASFALGGGRHYNITSPAGWVDLGTKDPEGNEEFSAAMTKLLITTQLDVFFPVPGASTVGAFLDQPLVDALPAGYNISFEPRLGLEKEVVADRLRLRLGSYLEPTMVSTGPTARPHINFGFELYLFKLGRQRLSFGLSFDFAHLYENLSVSILVWK